MSSEAPHRNGSAPLRAAMRCVAMAWHREAKRGTVPAGSKTRTFLD